jgi:hypothetical protein
VYCFSLPVGPSNDVALSAVLVFRRVVGRRFPPSWPGLFRSPTVIGCQGEHRPGEREPLGVRPRVRHEGYTRFGRIGHDANDELLRLRERGAGSSGPGRAWPLHSIRHSDSVFRPRASVFATGVTQGAVAPAVL